MHRLVGIFPDDASVIRLVSMLAIEANDEWLVGRSYMAVAQWRLSTRHRRPSLSSQIQQEVAELPPREHQRLHRRDSEDLLHHVLGLDCRGCVELDRAVVSELGP